MNQLTLTAMKLDQRIEIITMLHKMTIQFPQLHSRRIKLNPISRVVVELATMTEPLSNFIKRVYL